MTLRLILNADDFGYDPAVTRGIREAMQAGVVSSTTMIVNSPHSDDAALQSAGLAIGLHLNLLRFTAISEPGRELNEQTPLDASFVVEETSAQLDRLRAMIGREPTHIDVHKHAHTQPAVLEGLCVVARERSLAVRSITQDMRQHLRANGVRTNDAFLGDAGTTAFWTLPTWRAQLDAVPREGVVELMCHPGHLPSHLVSGYGAQREVELQTFLSKEAKDALTERGLSLMSWIGA